jgi:hypothetical protein
VCVCQFPTSYKKNKQTHNLPLNLYNVGILHFCTPLLPKYTKISVSLFNHPETRSTRDRCLYSDLQSKRRLKVFKTKLEKIYISNELPSQRTHINVSLVLFKCPEHAGNKNLSVRDIRPYLSGAPLIYSNLQFIQFVCEWEEKLITDIFTNKVWYLMPLQMVDTQLHMTVGVIEHIVNPNRYISRRCSRGAICQFHVHILFILLYLKTYNYNEIIRNVGKRQFINEQL